MKTTKLTVLLIILITSGCAAKHYESVTTGPRAKVTFKKSSEVLQKIDFAIFEADNECDLHGKGVVSLQKDNSQISFIPAGRTYISVWPDQPGLPLFIEASFVAEENKEYTIEYFYHVNWLGDAANPRFGVNYLQNLGDNTTKPVDTDH